MNKKKLKILWLNVEKLENTFFMVKSKKNIDYHTVLCYNKYLMNGVILCHGWIFSADIMGAARQKLQ